MKKLSVIALMIMLTMSSMAQITLWTSHPYKWQNSTFDEQLQQWVAIGEPFDTILPEPIAQYEYDEIDSVTFAISPQVYRVVDGKSVIDTLMQTVLWKNGKRFGKDTIVDSFTSYLKQQSIFVPDSAYLDYEAYYYEKYGPDRSYLLRLDSVIWHPYKVLDYQIAIEDTLYLDDPYCGYKNTRTDYGVQMQPWYANVHNYTITSSNPAVATVELKQSKLQDTNFDYWNNRNIVGFDLTLLTAGQTTITVELNGRKKSKTLTVLEYEIKDETKLTMDALYDKVYDRMTQTGNMHPAGSSDIPNVDEGSSGFYRAMHELQELPADQLWWIWADAGVDKLRTGEWDASNTLINYLFHRLYYNIYLCNSYLTRAEWEQAPTTRIGEVRFVRAYLYSQLMDLYGNVPIVTNNADFYTAKQATRSELYDFVVKELLQAEQEMPAKRGSQYRTDKAAAQLLLSRIYLNSEVYAGKADYNKAAEYAKKVIDNTNYALAEHYEYLFCGDNDRNGAEQEMIWSLWQEGKEQLSYAGSQYAVLSFYDKPSMPYVGVNDSWMCMRSSPELVYIFFNKNKANSVKGVVADIQAAAGDKRAMFVNSYNGNTWKLTGGMASDFYASWGVQKWTNLMAIEGNEPTDENWVDTDIPLFRKAEAYLNYAEAVLRGGAVQNGLSALDAVNTVRTRAEATRWNEVTLEQLLDERGREFYAEGMRRTDLIRFGKFGGCTDYWWEGKGNRTSASESAFPAKLNLYPIPQTIFNLNPNLKQNEGY